MVSVDFWVKTKNYVFKHWSGFFWTFDWYARGSIRARQRPGNGSERWFKMTIRQLRIMAGLTQGQLSQKLSEAGRGKGYQGSVQKLEGGKNSPTVSKLADVLEALGHSLVITAVNKETGHTIEMDLSSLLGTHSAHEYTREVDNA